MTTPGALSALRLVFALLTLAALAVQLARSPSPATFFSFFTVESNILAAGVLLIAAVRGFGGRDLTPLDMWRGGAVHGDDGRRLRPAALRHGGRGRAPFARAFLWFVFPVVYLVYSLARGALVGWYPYPFLDPTGGRGYGGVAVAAVFIAVGVVGVTALLVWTAPRRAGARAASRGVARVTAGHCDEGARADPTRLVARADPRLLEHLERLAAQRMVFFAGLPGTGKSLLTHQLAHLAHARGRVVHLLQWDVARPAIETSEAGRRYPVRDGVSHAAVRMAAGLWARDAIARWAARTGPEALLIGETPFVGHRFIELARRADDAAEPHLSAPSCRFVVPVPSPEVRAFLEAERARRATRPLHAREAEDAPPQVLRDLWAALVEAATALGVAAGRARGAPYDPVVYRRLYEALLTHRHADVAALETILPIRAFSVYDYSVAREDVMPTPQEAARFIGEVEARYPGPGALEAAVTRWWAV